MARMTPNESEDEAEETDEDKDEVLFNKEVESEYQKVEDQMSEDDEKPPRKPWQKNNFVEGKLRGQARAQLIHKLNEACTNADDRTMLVRHRSSDCVMS